MSTVLTMYVLYLAISIALTVWVARTLARHGSVFLVDVFGDERVATAVNRLLVVGFYLINLGYVGLAIRIGSDVADARDAVEALSVKVGGVLLVLGAMHLLNVWVFSRIRRRSRLDRMPAPPVPPNYWAPPPTPQQPAPAAPR
jgi:hypothetical protein